MLKTPIYNLHLNSLAHPFYWYHTIELMFLFHLSPLLRSASYARSCPTNRKSFLFLSQPFHYRISFNGHRHISLKVRHWIFYDRELSSCSIYRHNISRSTTFIYFSPFTIFELLFPRTSKNIMGNDCFICVHLEVLKVLKVSVYTLHDL